MSAVTVLLFWFRTSLNVEDSRLQRMEGIKGHRLARTAPTVRVFSGRKAPIAQG
jgi:hypothetical protein